MQVDNTWFTTDTQASNTAKTYWYYNMGYNWLITQKIINQYFFSETASSGF